MNEYKEIVEIGDINISCCKCNKKATHTINDAKIPIIFSAFCNDCKNVVEGRIQTYIQEGLKNENRQ